MPAAILKSLIHKVAESKTLSEEEMRAALEIMTDGHATPAQMGAFLMALRVRGETVEEITGAAQMMRSKMRRVTAPPGAVDIVGTGAAGRPRNSRHRFYPGFGISSRFLLQGPIFVRLRAPLTTIELFVDLL